MWTFLSVTVYALLLTWVALKARNVRQFSDFSVAGRSLTLPLIFGSLAATFVGPGFSIGFVGKGYSTGYLFVWAGVALAIQNVLVGVFLAPRLRTLQDCHTLGDVIGQKYNRSCQVFAGLISIGLCTGLAGVMIKAGSQLITEASGIPLWISVVLVGGITTSYTAFGGLRASVLTDAFQFTAFTIMIPIIFLVVIFGGISWGAFSEKTTVLTKYGANLPLSETMNWIIAIALGETLLPPYANRALASRTTKISSYGFILAGLFCILWFVVMNSMGIMAAMDPSITEQINSLSPDKQEDMVLLAFVSKHLPAAFFGLLIVVLMSIVMSSLDSLLNAGAVAFTRDIIQPFKPLNQNQSLFLARLMTLLTAIGAAAGAFTVPGILAGLRACYSIWVPAILPVLIIGLWKPTRSSRAGFACMMVGTVISIVILIQGHSNIFIAIIAAVIAYGLGCVLDRNMGGGR